MRTRFINYLILPLVAFMTACSTSPSEGEGEPPVSGDIHVTGISFDVDRVELNQGETYDLTITVSPSDATDKSFTIKSNNISVARVSETGRITAVGNNTAIITATTNDGGLKATCTVVVGGGSTPETTVSVTSVALDQSSLTLQEGEQTTLGYHVYPNNADNKAVYWDVDDENVATVNSNGQVTAIKEGTTIN